jgi:hypothetical protein
MGKRGDGYGSEDHLLRYFSEHRPVLNAAVASELGVPASSVSWLDFPRRTSGEEREFRGVEFLPANDLLATALTEWKGFWPQTGRQQTWDAVGRAEDEWLLVEAKANQPEFCSPPTTAKPEGGRPQIERALSRVKRDLGVHRYYTWTGTYYQYANRLAMLWFLRNQGVPARLLFIYFTGDVFPDGTPCPQDRDEWEALIEARRLTLGLPRAHSLSPWEHHLVLPV